MLELNKSRMIQEKAVVVAVVVVDAVVGVMNGPSNFAGFPKLGFCSDYYHFLGGCSFAGHFRNPFTI